MDDQKTKIEPLTPEQAAWYAEQEAKWRKEKKLTGIFMIVLPIFLAGISVFLFEFRVFRDPQLMSKLPLSVVYFLGGVTIFVMILSALIFGFLCYAADNKLEKLQHERLFREK